MVWDQLELEEKREKDREKAWEKRYEPTLRKCYKQTKKFRLIEIDKKKQFDRCKMVVIKELLRYTLIYVK